MKFLASNYSINSLLQRNLLFAGLILFMFSLDAQTHIQSDQIIQEINDGKSVQYENVTIRGDFDFTLIQKKSKGGSYGIRGGVAKEYIGKVMAPVTFINCTFLGEIITFKENRVPGVRKENFTWFEAPVTFRGCTFQERAQFLRMNIRGLLTIEDCVFEDDIRFDRVGFAQTPIFGNNDIKGSFTNKRTNWLSEAVSLKSEKPRPANAVNVNLKNSSFKKINIKFGSNKWTLSPMGTSGLETFVGEKIYLVKKGEPKEILLEVTKEMDGKTIDVSKS